VFDPGIGFGKNLQQNLLLLKNIKKLKIEKYGLLLGSSRKSWISDVDNSQANQRLGGSLASVLYCFEQGVDIFRVHDVQETHQAIKIFKEIKCSK
jgi:dihydropteroate synthase